MQMTIPQDLLSRYVRTQVNTFFPDGCQVTQADLTSGISDALGRLEHCFLRIKVARYCAEQQARFNHLYSDQYLMFLWFLSNSLWKKGSNENTLNKVYLLNKSLHAFDCAFDTALPDIFIVIHGVGTVLGKAKYSDFFAVYQGCTVGQTQGNYPHLGRGVGLGAGASIVGKSDIGDYSSVGAGCALINTNVGSDATAYRDEVGRLVFRKGRPAAIAKQYFSEEYLLSSKTTIV
jgi:serine O-acetyltransferase